MVIPTHECHMLRVLTAYIIEVSGGSKPPPYWIIPSVLTVKYTKKTLRFRVLIPAKTERCYYASVVYYAATVMMYCS